VTRFFGSTPPSTVSTPFSEHDWKNGGGIFNSHFFKIASENPVMWLFESTPFSPPLVGRFGRMSSVLAVWTRPRLCKNARMKLPSEVFPPFNYQSQFKY